MTPRVLLKDRYVVTAVSAATIILAVLIIYFGIQNGQSFRLSQALNSHLTIFFGFLILFFSITKTIFYFVGKTSHISFDKDALENLKIPKFYKFWGVFVFLGFGFYAMILLINSSPKSLHEIWIFTHAISAIVGWRAGIYTAKQEFQIILDGGKPGSLWDEAMMSELERW